MHSLETIKRLNDQRQRDWVQEQAKKPVSGALRKQLLIFMITQAMEEARSNKEAVNHLSLALRLLTKSRSRKQRLPVTRKLGA